DHEIGPGNRIVSRKETIRIPDLRAVAGEQSGCDQQNDRRQRTHDRAVGILPDFTIPESRSEHLSQYLQNRRQQRMERRRSCYISLLRETTPASDPEFSLAPATSGMDGIITVHT